MHGKNTGAVEHSKIKGEVKKTIHNHNAILEVLVAVHHLCLCIVDGPGNIKSLSSWFVPK